MKRYASLEDLGQENVRLQDYYQSADYLDYVIETLRDARELKNGLTWSLKA